MRIRGYIPRAFHDSQRLSKRRSLYRTIHIQYTVQYRPLLYIKRSIYNQHFCNQVRSLMERNTDTYTSPNACRITVFKYSSVLSVSSRFWVLTSPYKALSHTERFGATWRPEGLVQIYLPSDLQNVDSEIPSFLRPYEPVLRPAEDLKKENTFII